MITIEYLVEKYECKPWSFKPNKLTWPMNVIDVNNLEEFNDILEFCKENFMRVEPAASGSMPYNCKVKHNSRYMVLATKASFELCFMTVEGCFRFVMKRNHKEESNTVTGSKALKVLFETAEMFNVLDVFQENVSTPEEGKAIKEEIESPIIATVDESYNGMEFDNVHHLDFNSSYASRIAETYPKLNEMYSYLYDHRKDNDGYYKHVLTNSIGAMQSKYCMDVTSAGNYGYRRVPYQLAKFAKVAINGNNDKIREMLMILNMSGRKPLLVNTDGIWYQGDAFHDKCETTKLKGWKTDHKNCKLYIKSAGAYQFIEDGKVHSVVRGYTRLDEAKPDRSTWNWHEIDEYPGVFMYEYDKDKEEIIKKWVD